MTYMDGAAPLNFSTGGMTPCFSTHLRQACHSGRCDTAASRNAFGNHSGATGSSAYAHSIKRTNLTTNSGEHTRDSDTVQAKPIPPTGPSHNHGSNA